MAAPPTDLPGTGAPRPALAPLLALGALVALVLVAGSGGYGYHRDELYFLAAGRHLAWAYADQGPLTPLVARAADAVAPGSLVALRLPSALMAGTTVALTGLIAAELGGRRRAQLIAATCAAVASVVLIVGHLLSTATFDLMAWTAVTWLVARALRTGAGAPWLAAGVVAGLALLDKPLIAFLLVALGVGIAAAGPRELLRRPAPWAGAAIALVLWSPWLIWQAGHGWPQLDVSSSIASGGSSSSQPRWALLPFQLLLVSPVLAPVWIAGLVDLARRPELRPHRLFAVAWVVLAVVFLATGGKPYYLAGMFGVLLAAGALRADAWLDHGARRVRAGLLAVAVVLSAVVSVTLALPVLPARDAGVVIAMNGDIGETIGWPALARTVAGVYRDTPGAPVILTSNYGEAGAIDRYGPALGLPAAFSGHNAFHEWGPPPDRPSPVITVGFSAARLRADFTGCRVAARIDNAAGVDNDERGEPVDRCAGTRAPWSRLWPGLRRLG
ncbi:glycosyltransferase family 39 protein [Baekduia soli]|uniref:Glycosyltransferase family 39 protein n=1 Tax=Baekduia soli TaxID=496014 RepID=A0A5B8U7B4_9ACTN|nr:glycosyltransferase family 39 protein [Baekduia soli]QEC48718.1 glycosyltransferase family 39 protein [Baekduia soli]